MKNIRELREGLVGVFEGLKAGTIKPAEATELNNAAGKIINSLKVELEYYDMRGEKPAIEFLGAEKPTLQE